MQRERERECRETDREKCREIEGEIMQRDTERGRTERVPPREPNTTPVLPHTHTHTHNTHTTGRTQRLKIFQ